MLELASVQGAKVEQCGDDEVVSFATPATGEVMKELVCDRSIHEILKDKLEGTKTWTKFQASISGKCRRSWWFRS